MYELVRRIWANETGATAIEYSLIAGIISLAVITGAQGIGLTLISIFEDVVAGFKGG